MPRSGVYMLVTGLAVCTIATSPAGAQESQTAAEMGAMDSTESSEVGAATHAMGHQMAQDAHTRLTPMWPASAADSARAWQLVRDMRRTLNKYRDVQFAEADGFRMFLPRVKQPLYHFTKRRWAIEAMFKFDPARPTSLLYQESQDGHMHLVGAMYTAPARTTEAELDRRVPLSVARWHEHVNWCLPPLLALGRWREERGGKRVFGPQSLIVTQAGCDSVGGRFKPRIFGWMVHVQAFASDDPAVIWSAGHQHSGNP